MEPSERKGATIMREKEWEDLIRAEIEKGTWDPVRIRSAINCVGNKVYLEFLLKQSKKGKINYKRPALCRCFEPELSAVNVWDDMWRIHCKSCGSSFFTKHFCQGCNNIFLPSIDPCNHGYCRECFPKFVEGLREKYEYYKKLLESEENHDES